MPLPLRIPFHISGRAKPHSQLYFGMCAKALLEYRSLVSQLSRIDSMKPEYDGVYALANEASIKPVVFGAMCVESTLFDLSATLFDERYASKIDRIPPPERFAVLAERIDGEVPKPDLAVVKAISDLFAARKRLIHYKSKSLIKQDWNDLLDEYRKDHKIHMHGIDSSFRAPVLLSIHFDGNIFENFRILPSFKLPEYWELAVPLDLHDDIRECIKAGGVQRNAS